MKYFSVLLFIVFLLSCNQQDSKPSGPVVSDTPVNQPPVRTIDTVPAQPEKDAIYRLTHRDSMLLQQAEKVLVAIKAKDFVRLSGFVHPKLGVRFSPYAYIDTTRTKLLSATQVPAFDRQNNTITWGSYDGSGEPIRLTIRKYVDRFVYDADFLHAEKKRVNEFIGYGNSLNNLKEVYPACDFAEFYFSGFDPQKGGMDWKTLRLVFRTENGIPWLVALVHGEWTI